MNIDPQSSALSAYLDDELDPEARLQVDAALLSDPRLGETLHGLTAVRDLVSGLAAPELPRDFSGDVVAAIRRRQAAAWSRHALVFLSIAATLVGMIAIGVRQAATDAPKVVGTMTTPPAPVPVVAQASPTDSADVPRGDVDEHQARSLLESPNLRKVLIVTDIVGDDAGRQVGDLIEKTPRRSAPYRRFTVSQQIVIDPEHPGEATVFAVVMDDQELGNFEARLHESFPASTVKESAPRPELLAGLTRVGQVRVFSGTSSPQSTASTARPGPGRTPGPGSLAHNPGADTPVAPTGQEPFKARGAVAPSERRRVTTDSAVVLVLVAPPRHPGRQFP